MDALDPRGGQIRYVLINGPAGASLDTTTGLLSWSPGSGDSASQSFEVRAIDGSGAYARQSFTVTVSGTNNAPVLAAVSGSFRRSMGHRFYGRLGLQSRDVPIHGAQSFDCGVPACDIDR